MNSERVYPREWGKVSVYQIRKRCYNLGLLQILSDGRRTF